MDTPAKSPFEPFRKLILEGEAEQACLHLSELAQGKLRRFSDEVDAIHIRINRLDEKIIKHVINQEEEEIQWNKINAALLKLLSQMEDASQQPELPDATPASAEIMASGAPAMPKSTASPSQERKASPLPKPDKRTLPTAAWQSFFSKSVLAVILAVAILAGGWAAVHFFSSEKSSPVAPFSLAVELRMASGHERFQPRGKVQLAFGSEVFSAKQLSAERRATFENIPGKFWKDTIRLVTDGLQQHFKVVRQNIRTAEQGKELVFELEPVFEKYTGKVVRFDSGEPVPGAVVTVGNDLAKDTTDRAGNFELNLAEKEVPVQIHIRHRSGEMTEEILLDKARMQRLKFKPEGN